MCELDPRPISPGASNQHLRKGRAPPRGGAETDSYPWSPFLPLKPFFFTLGALFPEAGMSRGALFPEAGLSRTRSSHRWVSFRIRFSLLYTYTQCHGRSSPSSPPTLTIHRVGPQIGGWVRFLPLEPFSPRRARPGILGALFPRGGPVQDPVLTQIGPCTLVVRIDYCSVRRYRINRQFAQFFYRHFLRSLLWDGDVFPDPRKALCGGISKVNA